MTPKSIFIQDWHVNVTSLKMVSLNVCKHVFFYNEIKRVNQHALYIQALIVWLKQRFTIA